MSTVPMPDVTEISIAGQRRDDDSTFPLAFANRSGDATLEATVEWARTNRAKYVDLVEHCGAVLFRGLPLRTDRDFDRFIEAFGLPNFAYDDSLSNAVRVNRTPRVFTANEAPPEVTIFLHHEMAQTPVYPSKLFFFCEKPAEVGGATPLCRSDVLWRRLSSACPEFARNCVERGLRYSNVMPGAHDFNSGMGRSWQSTLKAATREDAERRLAKMGYAWQWLNDDCLRVTTPVLRAVYDLPDGRRSFFNQLIAAYRGWKDVRNDPAQAVTFGDGSPLDGDAVTAACEIADELTFDMPWQAGDVVLIDNLVAMHGRRTFGGTRKVLASLVAHVSTGAA